MTLTGTVTKAVSKRITSPSSVSPAGLIFVSVVMPSSAGFAGSVFVGLGSDVFRPDCAYRLNGRKTLKSRISDSLVLNIKILGLENVLRESALRLWIIDAANYRRVDFCAFCAFLWLNFASFDIVRRNHDGTNRTRTRPKTSRQGLHRTPERPRPALLHRALGALQLLRHARHPCPLYGGASSTGRSGLRREARRLDLRLVHDVRLHNRFAGRTRR